MLLVRERLAQSRDLPSRATSIVSYRNAQVRLRYKPGHGDDLHCRNIVYFVSYIP